MKDLGAVSYCLGIKIVRDRENGTLKLSQEQYVKQVLKKFVMEDLKAVSTPLEANHNLQRNIQWYYCRAPISEFLQGA
jgi:ATP-binding cassette subfamily B (MDR/TAP) protein 1